ncbi:MAG TPA: NFACT RNA binding domain-containing protein [Chlorobiota bacterium]|nr:NFACT RNA binding domain-containing protein [Chlorobiota bacterium]
MIRQHIVLERLADELSRALSGSTVVEIFSQEKFVVTLRFLRDNELTSVVADVGPKYGTVLVRPQRHRARSNSIDLFPSLVSGTLAAVTIHPTDRVLSFWFNTGELHCLLYGGGKGNIVRTENGIIVEALRQPQLVLGTTLSPADTEPPLGPFLEAELNRGRDVGEEIRTSNIFRIYEIDNKDVFSPIELHTGTETFRSEDIFEAISTAIARKGRREHLEQRRAEIRRLVSRRLHKLERSITAIQTEAQKAQRGDSLRHLADLLMSYPQPHPTGLDTVTMESWDGTTVSIRLNPLRSIIENAHDYYRKARQADEAAASRQVRLPKLQAEYSHLTQQLQTVEQATEIKELENMIHQESRQQKGTSTPVFREFDLGEGWTVYVGRNANNNDELTMRFAKQNDTWLHARGVGGSHAVLRGVGNPPKRILEQAAAIAAWYSQARNASWTPVVYTLKKHVRKPKGAAVGAVTLERESVVMVKPALPKGAEGAADE